MNATQAYALSKAYTKATVEGAGAVKGAPCTIQSIEEIEGGNRVTFAWEKTTGEIVTESMDVMDGEKGDAGDIGVGISSITQQGDILTIHYTDGTISAPIIVPTVKGDDGYSPEITVAESSSTVYKLHIKTADDEYDTPNLKGGGSGGTSDYTELDNKPSINGVELVGNKTSEDLGIFGGNDFSVDNEVLVISDNGGGGGGGSSAELQSSLTAHVTVGGTTEGETFAKGTTLEYIFRDMLDPVMYPTLTNPSVTLTATGSRVLEKGASLNVTFTANFNRGSISPAYGTSGYRSGAATGYSLNGGAVQSSNSWNVFVNESQKTYQVTANYSAGEQPKDSTGANYGIPLPSGNVSSNVIAYEFVDAVWANTTDISMVTKQALVNSSTKAMTFVYPAATVEYPEIFDVPAEWTITNVEVLNTLNNQWEDCSAEFDVTDYQHDNAGGTSVAYKRYTNNLGYAMGSRSIRIKWR